MSLRATRSNLSGHRVEIATARFADLAMTFHRFVCHRSRRHAYACASMFRRSTLLVHLVEGLLRADDGGSHHVFGLRGFALGQDVHERFRVQLAGRLLAGLPAQDAAHDAIDALLGVVIGAGLHVMTLPAIVPGSQADQSRKLSRSVVLYQCREPKQVTLYVDP